MKVHGNNNANFNAYKNNIQKQTKFKNEINQKDQLEISTEAKQMLSKQEPSLKRAAYVDSIKQTVQSGDYKLDHEKTVQKLISFWTKQK